jgi:cytochrome c oxidase subunit 3
MSIFVFVELMFFAGLVSAFLIAKGSLPPFLWPPPDQPRFPVADTAINTAALLASGLTCWFSARAWRRAPGAGRGLMLLTLALGALFVGMQGVEWVQLIRQGLTLHSSQAGAYFFLLVGAHAAHAIVGLAVLGWAISRMAGQRLTSPQITAVQILWIFVVGLWPILYALVYLA